MWRLVGGGGRGSRCQRDGASLWRRLSGGHARIRGATASRRAFSTAWRDETTETPAAAATATSVAALPEGSQPLGSPMPVDEHACSVSLPTWASVVGYEEGNPAVVNAMQLGYPRFVYHPYVLQLMKYVVAHHANRPTTGTPATAPDTPAHTDKDCLLLPSIHAARRCQIFLLRALYGDDAPTTHLPDPASVGNMEAAQVAADAADTPGPVRVLSLPLANATNTTAQVHAVLFPATTAMGTQAKAYWQHTGEVVSSRRAQACLQHLGQPLVPTGTPPTATHHNDESSNHTTVPLPPPPQEEEHCRDPFTPMRHSLAEWAGTRPRDVFLTPSGMSAVYVALQSARRRHMALQPQQQGGRAIVYGFPYLDTLKLCSRSELCPDGVEFFGRADARDLAALEAYLAQNPNAVSIVLTEVPSNPLLHCPNVVKLRQLADEYNFLLVVDDTISNFLNVDLLASGLADATVSSLTKLVSGRGDAMAGSVVCSPSTAGGQWMQNDLAHQVEGIDSGLYGPDALALWHNSRDFPQRNARINATTESLVDWLAGQDAVQRVYYPKHSHSVGHYQQVLRPQERAGAAMGYGGLFSMVLNSHMCERTFYDALNVAKGPSLGTNFTLVCPYTLLAHYHELDFAMSYDVPPNLIRVAVGLEPYETLREKFETALSSSRLYPKVCMDTVEKRKQGQRPLSRQFSTVRLDSSSSSCHHGHVPPRMCRGNSVHARVSYGLRGFRLAP